MRLAQKEITVDEDLGDDFEELPQEPPQRPVKEGSARRQVAKTTERPAGTSWWLNKSREELNAEAERRVPEMRQSKVGLKVKGIAREA